MRLVKPIITTVLAVSLAATLGLGVALAHGDSVAVDPTSAQPGATITVKGGDLGASRSVDVKLVGTGVERVLGTAQTDGDGAFTATFEVPSDLAAGPYQIQAEGEDTATTDFTVTAAVGSGASEGQMSGQEVQAPQIPVRERPLSETAGLVALFGVLSGLGLFFARTARRQSVPQYTPSSSNGHGAMS